MFARRKTATEKREGASEFYQCLMRQPGVEAAQSKLNALSEREKELRSMLDDIREPEALGEIEPAKLSAEIERHAEATLQARRDREGFEQQLAILVEQRSKADGELVKAMQAAKVEAAPKAQEAYDALMGELDIAMAKVDELVDREKSFCDTAVGPKTSVANLLRRHACFPLFNAQGHFTSFKAGYAIYKQMRNRR